MRYLVCSFFVFVSLSLTIFPLLYFHSYPHSFLHIFMPIVLFMLIAQNLVCVFTPNHKRLRHKVEGNIKNKNHLRRLCTYMINAMCELSQYFHVQSRRTNNHLHQAPLYKFLFWTQDQVLYSLLELQFFIMQLPLLTLYYRIVTCR